MTDLTPDVLRAAADRWDELLTAASLGPWQVGRGEHWDPRTRTTIYGHAGTRPEALTHVCSIELGWTKDADAVLIATSRAALDGVPAMLRSIADEHDVANVSIPHIEPPRLACRRCSRAISDPSAYVAWPCPTMQAVAGWVEAVTEEKS